MHRIAFILHGDIRRKARLKSAINKVFQSFGEVSISETEAAGQTHPIAMERLRDGFTHLISLGGDGSLNELVNGLMEATTDWSAARRSNLRVGTLPYGTGNDYLKSVNGPTTLEGMKAAIEADRWIPVDIGLAHFTDTEGRAGQRYFINIADLGLGGSIARKVSSYSRRWGRRLNYQRGILTTLPCYKHQPVSMIADQLTYEGDVMSLVIAKGKYFGGGLGIAPQAEVDDGQFAITIVGQIGLLSYLRHLGTIRKCGIVDHPQVRYAHGAALKVTGREGPMPIDMDGEFVGYSPMTASVVPGALSFLV